MRAVPLASVPGDSVSWRTVRFAVGDRDIPADLRPFVEGSWTYYAEPSDACVERTAAEDCTNVIVHMTPAGAVSTFVCGPAPTFRPIETEPGAVNVGVRLRPGALTELLGVPGSEIAGRKVDLEDIVPGVRRAVIDAVEGEAEQAFRVTMAFLRARAAARPVRRRVERVREAVHWFSAVNARGLVELTGELNTSERTLRRDFASVVGLGPKRFARILRVRRASRELESARSLAAVAFTSGFADHAHMTREFVSLIGLTPRQVQRAAMPFVSGVTRSPRAAVG